MQICITCGRPSKNVQRRANAQLPSGNFPRRSRSSNRLPPPAISPRKSAAAARPSTPDPAAQPHRQPRRWRPRRRADLDPSPRAVFSADSAVGRSAGARDGSRSSWLPSGVGLLAAGASKGCRATTTTEPSGHCFGRRRRRCVAAISLSHQPQAVKEA